MRGEGDGPIPEARGKSRRMATGGLFLGQQPELCKPAAKGLSGEFVLGFFVDQQIDQSQPLWLIVRFGQQSAIAIKIESSVV